MLSIEILGDPAVVRAQPGWCTLDAACHSREQLHALRPPELFAACIDGDALALYRCLVDPFQPTSVCLPGPLECPR